MEVQKRLFSKEVLNIEHINLTLQNEIFNCNGEFICSLLDEKNKFNYLSLQFFSDTEDDDTDENDDIEEESEESSVGGKIKNSFGKDNPVISKARKKAQEVYDKSAAKDKLNQVGEKAGDKTKDLAYKAGDAVGGKLGNGIKNVGDVAGNKMSKAGDNLSNKIGENQQGNSLNGQLGKSFGSAATDKAQDAAADVAGKAAGAAVEGAVASTGVGAPVAKVAKKVTEKATGAILKSGVVKKIGCIGCLGCGGFLTLTIGLPIILLYTFGAEVLLFLTGLFYNIGAGFIWLITLGNVDIAFNDMVNDKLEGIYKERDSRVSQSDDNMEEADFEFASDLAQNIDRERMKRYVQAELSGIFYIAETNEDGSIGSKHEAEITEIYKLMADRDNQKLADNFWDKLWDGVDNSTSDALIFNSEEVKYEFNLGEGGSYDNIRLQSEQVAEMGDEQIAILLAYAKQDIHAIEGGKKNDIIKTLPDGLEEILSRIPTAEGFYGPLEYSMGNPAKYNAYVDGDKKEEIIPQYEYEKVVVDEYGYIDHEKSTVKSETIPQVNIGDVVTGNPPVFQFILPEFYTNAGAKIKEQTTFDEGNKKTRAFVLDIARLNFDNPVWREQENTSDLKPFTITAQVLPHKTEIVEEYIYEGEVEYEDPEDEDKIWSATYTVPVKKTTVKIEPTIEIAILEEWNRKETNTFQAVKKDPITETMENGGTRVTVKTVYEKKDSKLEESGYADRFIIEYGLEDGDFGIYEEITGQKFFSLEDEYMIISNSKYNANFLESGLVTPLADISYISSGYGYRTIPGREREFHGGVDFPATKGTPIYSIAEGKVVKVADMGTKSYGKYCIIEHKLTNGAYIYSLYAHQYKVKVKEGQQVMAGEVIGLVGNSGSVYSSTGGDGSHLHFEIREDKNLYSNVVNPLKYLTDRPMDMAE